MGASCVDASSARFIPPPRGANDFLFAQQTRNAFSPSLSPRLPVNLDLDLEPYGSSISSMSLNSSGWLSDWSER